MCGCNKSIKGSKKILVQSKPTTSGKITIGGKVYKPKTRRGS